MAHLLIHYLGRWDLVALLNPSRQYRAPAWHFLPRNMEITPSNHRQLENLYLKSCLHFCLHHFLCTLQASIHWFSSQWEVQTPSSWWWMERDQGLSLEGTRYQFLEGFQPFYEQCHLKILGCKFQQLDLASSLDLFPMRQCYWATPSFAFIHRESRYFCFTVGNFEICSGSASTSCLKHISVASTCLLASAEYLEAFHRLFIATCCLVLM